MDIIADKILQGKNTYKKKLEKKDFVKLILLN